MLGVIFLSTVLTVVGDVFLKRANNHEVRFGNRDFVLGMLIYVVTAFIWVIIYRMTKFSLSGVVYSVLGIIMYVAVGVFIYGEKLSGFEYVGMGMAIGSLMILTRFL